MTCSSCNTLTPIYLILEAQLPPISTPVGGTLPLEKGETQLPPLYPGILTVALREGPLPSPHPLCSSPWAVGLVFGTLQRSMG